ncbi:hypothetical protein SAMN05444166_0321 [Singulisphaera sp. GP187]|uniref:DUF5947 family protein n=1 Tax=Singulisphaera sp. GP187 TaxID=1882752 RepID=UPI000928B879|nr:DUF5947 family protein [Singulisphaera sp. GP187]SIN71108.1 hypothetical protein SAMN05444166_0321 [Singulisphaera sp. GP187]
MLSDSPAEPQPWAMLRQFVRGRPPVERCELCGLGLAAEHPHLWESATRQLHCCCDACSILFSGQRPDARYRRVPARVELLTDFHLSDEQWEDLHLPINLAFFVRCTAAGRVLAYFPSPAGATESLLSLETWDQLVRENSVLETMEPDVEALLVNRLGELNESYYVSIDECYKLVGLIRTHWRGLSGGTTVWAEIGTFFAGLKRRSRPSGDTPPCRT